MMSFWYFTLLNICTDQKYHQKYIKSYNCNKQLVLFWFFLKSQKSLELVSSLHNRGENELEMFVISCINIGLNVMFKLPGVLENNQEGN